MIPLPTSQLVMTWLCMCPAKASTSKMKRMCYAGFTFTVFLLCFSGFASALAFVIKYVATDLEGALYAAFQVSGYTSMLNLLLTGLINRHRIAKIYTELSQLYAASKNWE